MSDNDGEGFFLPFPFAPPSEEMLERMREMRDHQEMEADDYRHSTARLFDGMTEDQLVTMKRVFHVMVMGSGPKSRALGAYYEGIITGILHARFSVCLGCDHNHDKVMEEQLQRETANQEPLVAMDGGDPFKPAPTKPDLQIGEAGFLSDVQLELMEEYGLDDLRSENDGVLLGFICINCKTQYVSIDDRILRPPGKDGCSGCQQKEMWG